MSARKMIEGLSYGHSDVEFFKRLDAAGGWPIGYKYAGFAHTSEREAGFCNSPYNDGWWTVVANADDYYLWKLSPDALQRVVDAAISAARVTRVNAQHVHIKNSRGYKASIAEET